MEMFLKLIADLYFEEGVMVIPNKFVQAVFRGNMPRDVVLVNKFGQEWKITVSKRGEWHCFDRGWKEFLAENYMEECDTVLFKYVGNSVFETRQFDGTECEKELLVIKEKTSEYLGIPSGNPAAVHGCGLTPSEAADAFTSPNPFFTARLTDNYIQHGNVHVPADFMRDHGLRRGKCLNLKVGS